MAIGELYLGPIGSEVLLSPFGRTLRIKPVYRIMRDGPTANGRLVRDYGGSKKYEFLLEYDRIDGTALETILDLEDLNDELSLIVWSGAMSYDSYTVLMDAIERERILLLGDGIWGGVSVSLRQV